MITKLEPRFIETIPANIEDGILYISIRFRVAIHLCCCGCKNKAVTPFSPVRWKMIYDGKTVSLDPSIGNWNFDCQSHYWITNNEVEWAGKWSKEKIDRGKMVEKQNRAEYYKQVNASTTHETELVPNQPKSNLSEIIKWIMGVFLKK